MLALHRLIDAASSALRFSDARVCNAPAYAGLMFGFHTCLTNVGLVSAGFRL